MNAFRVSGNFKMGEKWMPFTIEVVADDSDHATERTLSLLGSRHRVKRTNIEIADIKGISLEEATSAKVQYHLGGGGK